MRVEVSCRVDFDVHFYPQSPVDKQVSIAIGRAEIQAKMHLSRYRKDLERRLAAELERQLQGIQGEQG